MSIFTETEEDARAEARSENAKQLKRDRASAYGEDDGNDAPEDDDE